MRTLTVGVVLVVSLLAAVPLFALNPGGSPVIIPVIGRFAGSGGTQWQTDVFLSNPYSPTQIVTLKFYHSGSTMKEATVTMGPFSTITLPDIVLNTFGFTSAGGMLEVFVAESSTILARAAIYNTGNPAGQFGQGIPGIATRLLSRQAYLHGLSGVDGSRVNIGVANPNDTAVQVTIRVATDTNDQLHSRSVTVAPHAYVQYNDIFATFGIEPRAGVQVNFTTAGEELIYGYSSEVRNDTGDAIFNFGTSPNS